MSTDRSVEQLQADIARTREDLAQTVDELAARLDVRTRVKERLRTIGVPRLGVGVAASVAVVAAIVMIRRRRR